MAGGLVLLYHRIAEPGCDPFGLRVAPERFRRQLQVLRSLGHPLPLPELVRRARNGTLPPRSVAITFDDGTPDLLEHALPALQETEVPATVFAATSGATRRDYWWEELASLLLRPGAVPAVLSLRLDRSWDLGRDAHYSGAAAKRHRAWRAFEQRAPTSRHALFEQLWRLLRQLPPAARDRAMARVRAWAGGAERRSRARARPLTRTELRQLAASGPVQLGAHTVRHPVLAALSLEEQWQEIHGSRGRLQATVGGQAEAFAYPFGSPDSFSAETVRLVREAGFRLACSTRAGRVHRSTDARRLPRLAVGDWDTDDFTRWFLAWSA